MKTLIEKIRAKLRTDISYVRTASIFVAEDLKLVPNRIMFPAIGIKDDGIDYDEAYQDEKYDAQMHVKIAAYVQIFKEEESILGDKGVLALMADILASLVDERFDISGLILAMPGSETGSELGFRDADMLMMKTLTMRYFKINSYI